MCVCTALLRKLLTRVLPCLSQVDDFLPGTLSMCNTAFMEKWAMRAETERRFPFDDREYYDLITRFLAQKVTYQANGAVMINEAFELLAMNAVMLKGRELNQTVAGYFVSGSFCDFVLGNRGNQSSALFAGYRFCKDKDTFFRKTYDNVVSSRFWIIADNRKTYDGPNTAYILLLILQLCACPIIVQVGQIEAVGQPFSWGGPGEGMRLLMGTGTYMSSGKTGSRRTKLIMFSFPSLPHFHVRT